MNGSMPMRGRRVYLRAFETMDFMDVYEHYASDPEVAEWVSWDPHPDSGTTMEYLLSIVPRYENPDYYHWAIELPTVGVIGAVEVVKEDKGSKTATIGYCLARKQWGQGIMSEVLSMVLPFLEDEGFLHFKAECLVENAASRRVLEKSGFRYKGEVEREVKGLTMILCVYERDAGEISASSSEKREDSSFTLDGGKDEGFDLSYDFHWEGK